MIFTDPPYNVDYSSKNEFLNLQDKGNHIQTPLQNDHVSEEEYIKYNRAWLDNCMDILTDYNTVYICGNYDSLMPYYGIGNFTISNMLVWVKNTFVLGRMDYKGQHEFILYGWRKHHKWYGGITQSTVWNYKKPAASKLHPTMKPVELCLRAIRNSSKFNDIILDLFGGSGSTLIACEYSERICYMSEIDPKYCDVIIERWEQLTGDKAERLK